MVTVFGLACVSVAEVAAVASPGGLHADHGRGLVISGQLADVRIRPAAAPASVPSAGPRVPPLSSTLCRQRQACESPSLARRSPRQQEGDHTHALALKWNARSTAPYEHEMRLCGGNHPCVDCGAVLIASDVAITAAHCFNWKPMTWSNAYYGAPNTASGSGWWLKVSAYNLRGKFPACPPEPPPRPCPRPCPRPAPAPRPPMCSPAKHIARAEHDEDGVPGAHDDHCDGWIAVETVTRHEYYVQATGEQALSPPPAVSCAS